MQIDNNNKTLMKKKTPLKQLQEADGFTQVYNESPH
jgi:hypothetical protein